MFNIQEEQNGKRSRNPSTSSGYGGFRIGGYRSRRASEGDEGAGVRGAGGASRASDFWWGRIFPGIIDMLEKVINFCCWNQFL